VALTEGKNREIRKLMEHFDCVVNRLLRVQYGPFYLGKLKSGEIEEVAPEKVRELLDYLATRGAVL
jgi:23S rRNA pseudouridine2605 synthase